MTRMDDVASLDALGQAELVRRKEISPVELVDAAIDRIERANPPAPPLESSIRRSAA